MAGYGGDGTQHEVANGILGTPAVMGVLPGGTGNGFATELATPKELRPAVELLCSGGQIRNIDVRQIGRGLFRPAPSTWASNRKSKRAVRIRTNMAPFAYAINSYHRARSKKQKEFDYKVVLDGQEYIFKCAKLYVVNAAMAGYRYFRNREDVQT